MRIHSNNSPFFFKDYLTNGVPRSDRLLINISYLSCSQYLNSIYIYVKDSYTRNRR